MSTSWKWVVSFTSWLLYHWEKCLRHWLIGWVGSRADLNALVQGKIAFRCRSNHNTTVQFLCRSVVVLQSSLCRIINEKDEGISVPKLAVVGAFDRWQPCCSTKLIHGWRWCISYTVRTEPWRVYCCVCNVKSKIVLLRDSKAIHTRPSGELLLWELCLFVIVEILS